MNLMNLTTEEGHFKGFDGSEMYFQTWPQVSRRGIIFGIHGLGEHSGSYRLLAEGLQGSGFQLVMSDLRGHGQSAGKRGAASIDDFVLDNKVFYTLVRERFGDVPLFFLGHSMGGLILAKLLIRHGDFGCKGAVLSSPLLGVNVEVPKWKEMSAGFLSKFAPSMTLDNEIPFENLTHNQEVIRSYETDPWRHRRISSVLFTEMLKSIEYVFAKSDIIQCPVLLQQSGDDKVVSAPKSVEFFEKLKTQDKTRIVYDGFYHEIYNEVWRETPFKDLSAWLTKHVEKKS